MARSVWKGPFVEESLIKKVEKQKLDPKKMPIKTWSRKSTIIPEFIGVSFLIYNGKNLYQLPFLKIWLDTNLVSFHQQEHFLDIHLQIKKQNQQQLKNNYE